MNNNKKLRRESKKAFYYDQTEGELQRVLEQHNRLPPPLTVEGWFRLKETVHEKQKELERMKKVKDKRPSALQKKAVVDLVLKEKVSVLLLAAVNKRSEESIYKWVQRFRRNGYIYEGRGRPRVLDDDSKRQIIFWKLRNKGIFTKEELKSTIVEEHKKSWDRKFPERDPSERKTISRSTLERYMKDFC